MNKRHLARKGPVRITEHPDCHGLIFHHRGEVTFGNVDHGPNDRMIRDTKSNVSRHHALAVEDVTLKHDAVMRCEPRERARKGFTLLPGRQK